MAWVTTLGPDMAQVEYRLSEHCGCDLEHPDIAAEHAEHADAQVDYRMGEARDLEWIGRGLADVGLVAGETVDKDAARALMDGCDPSSGEQLVKPKLAVDPRAKLQARGLVEAVTAAAAERGVTVAELLDDDKATKRFERLERGLRRDGDAHRLPVGDVDALADAAGIDAAAVYGKAQLAEARRHADKRIRIGNRGYDLTLDLSKTFSTVVALAGEDLAEQLRETFLEAARETVAAVEDWSVYAMAGHHGDGQSAARVPTSGALGWMTVHYSARPVDGVPGDPHLHVHVSLANMALAEDGKWRTIGAGGRDLHRHAHAADALVKARLRQLTAERFGVRWERHPETGAWEVAGVDERVRREFSRRAQQIITATGKDATTAEQKLAARRLAEGKDTDTPATDVRASWRERAERIVGDVDAMVRAAVPGPGGPESPAIDGPGGGPRIPPPADIAAHIWREDGGLTTSRKAVTRADVLAAVMDACPYGLPDLAAAEALTDAVLAMPGHAVPLPAQGAHHLSNAARYTHTSVLEAEQVIVETAAARLTEGAAQTTPEAAELAVSVFETARSTEAKPFRLSDQQRGVVHRLLTAGHGLDVVVGVAGAGKTTLLAAARSGWQATGLTVAGAATAAVAASNLQAGSGIASATVAAWLHDIADGGRRMAATDVLVLDEAAMIDDRALATLLRSANEHGVKVVAVGDWMQLKAIGIGGGFRRAHELVDGEVLTENRRQSDAVERAALEAWRDGGRRTALAALAERGRIHAVDTPDDAYAAMLAAWTEVRAGLDGDVVRIRRNDYRSRRDPDQVDILNGYRGEVTYAGPGGVRVQWRREGDDGEYVVTEAHISADQIAAGTLSHGYAMTIAAAQGLTSQYALVYGVGAEANTLYPAISRARTATHLWLPASVVEDDTTRRTLGEARTDAELLGRAVAAYAAALERDEPDGMISDQLTEVVIPHQEPAPAVHDRAAARHEQAQQPVVDPEAAEASPQHPQEALERFLSAGYVSRSPGPAAEPQEDAERPQERPSFEERAEQRRQALEELRVRYSGEQESEPEPERQVPGWRERPYGRLDTDSLQPAAERADQEAARARQAADQYAAQAEQLRAVLGTDDAPGRQTCARTLAHLDAAEKHLTDADAADKSAHGIDGQVQEMYKDNRKELDIERRIRDRAALKRMRPWRKGMLADADALRERIDQRTEQIDALREQAAELRSKANELRRQARADVDAAEGGTNYRPLPQRIADQRARLPQLTERLDAADQQRCEGLVEQAAEQTRTAETLTQRATGLREEATLRRELPAGQRTRESVERSKAHRLEAQRRSAEQARLAEQRRRQESEYRYQPPSQGRSGPSFGR